MRLIEGVFGKPISSSSSFRRLLVNQTFWLAIISGKFHLQNEGALGFSVLRIWPIFDSVFRFSLLKIAVFRFWCLVRFAGFLQFNLWFSVFVKNDGGFSDSSAQFILRFFCFCQGSHSHLAVTLKLKFQGLQLAAVISVVTAAKQPRGGTWVSFCWVYMCRWPLRAPNPL